MTGAGAICTASTPVYMVPGTPPFNHAIPAASRGQGIYCMAEYPVPDEMDRLHQGERGSLVIFRGEVAEVKG